MDRERFVIIGGVANRMSAASRTKRSLLDAQMIDKLGVANRTDIFATDLQSGMTIEDISRLDLSYSPPFAPFWDSTLVTANIGLRKLMD